MASDAPAASAINLLGQSAEELRAFARSLGEPAYRGAQIYHALYAERRFDVANFTNLPAAFREQLAESAAVELPGIVRRHSSADGTVRYVLALGASGRMQKPATIETVFMPEE